MKRVNHRDFLSDQAGATTVEFALIALPLILLTVGVAEVGRAIFTQQSLFYAVDNAVRQLYIDPDLDLEKSILDSSFLLNPANLSVSYIEPPAGCKITVLECVSELRVDYIFESIMAGWVLDMIPMHVERTVALTL